MKIIFSLFIVVLLSACGIINDPVVEENRSNYPGKQQKLRLEEKDYEISYELNDSLNDRNLPLYNDSPLVMNQTDSISSLLSCIQQIEFPEFWKEMGIQGRSYYGIHVNAQGEIHTITSLRVLAKNDLLLKQIEEYLLHLKFLESRYFNQMYTFKIKIGIE